MNTRPQRIYGTPNRVDAVFKAIARRVVAFLGVLCIPLLVWLQLWMWVPIPLLVLVVVNECFWWWRGDRPVEVRLSNDGLTVVDPASGTEHACPIGEITAINIWYRPRAGGHDVHIALFDGQRVRFAATTHCPPGAYAPDPTDIDVNRWESVLGEVAGIRNAVASGQANMRQNLRGGALVTWCRAMFPEEIHERTWARVWRGEEPELSLFGVHATEPDGVVQTGPNGPLLSPEGTAMQLSLPIAQSTTRTVTLLEKTPDGPQAVEGLIAMAVLGIYEGGRLLCPFASDSVAQNATSPSDLHTHTPEAMALLSHEAYRSKRAPLSTPPKTH